VHPGGPYFKNKDLGAWTIPKGAPEGDEELLQAARREFHEETGFDSEPPYHYLEPTTMRGGKVIHAWAFEGDCDPATLKSNPFEIEWPPRSGRWQSFPEVDRAEFFAPEDAVAKLHEAQRPWVSELLETLGKQ
jgi:predicted NUDIX family NTP pyrophosphohydrolase